MIQSDSEAVILTSPAQSEGIAHVLGITMVLSYFILSKTFGLQYKISVGIIVVGVALASFGEIDFSLVRLTSSLT